jgi:hypothetical protein
MRRLLLALPFALLPLAAAQANEHNHAHADEHAEHGSLDAHQHGAAQLNVVLDGTTLELELESPAMNLVGFEHAPNSAADKAKVAATRGQLQDPLALFGLSAGDCTLSEAELESALFADDEHEHEEQHADEADSEHSEIHAHYQLDCKKPGELQQLNLSELFKRFPATEKIQVQLIGPDGQQGVELTAANASLNF